MVGKDPSLVRQILYILSYFIRCSEVTEYSLKVQMDDEYDGYSLKHCDRLSSCSKTPTNTPNLDSWADNPFDRIRTEKNTDQSLDGLGRDRGKTLIEEKAAFDDAEQICNCMCSVLQSIDYVGEKGLRSLRKQSTRSDNIKHVEFENVLNAKNTNVTSLKNEKPKIIDKDIEKVEGKENLDHSKSNLLKHIAGHATFKCYCCPEKQSLETIGEVKMHFEETSSKHNELQRKSDILTHSDIAHRSCICTNTDTSEYGSETVSNGHSSLSRQSSCISCLEYFRKFEYRSQDLDSDYSSFTNEEQLAGSQVDHNGIDLDLHEIVENNNSVDDDGEEVDKEDDLDSMNLIEIPLPE